MKKQSVLPQRKFVKYICLKRVIILIEQFQIC